MMILITPSAGLSRPGHQLTLHPQGNASCAAQRSSSSHTRVTRQASIREMNSTTTADIWIQNFSHHATVTTRNPGRKDWAEPWEIFLKCFHFY